jgi:hypothetical protein
MMQAAKKIYELNLSDRLHMEYFQPVVDETLEAQPVTFLRRNKHLKPIPIYWKVLNKRVYVHTWLPYGNL